MRELDDGKTFVITRRDEPVGELRPLRRRRLVDAQAIVDIFRGAPAVDVDRFRAVIDAGFETGIEPRV